MRVVASSAQAAKSSFPLPLKLRLVTTETARELSGVGEFPPPDVGGDGLTCIFHTFL